MEVIIDLQGIFYVDALCFRSYGLESQKLQVHGSRSHHFHLSLLMNMKLVSKEKL